MNDTNATDSSALTSPSVTMSKSQQKKLEKRQKWLLMKPMRKAKEKLKRKQKIQQAKQEGRDLGPSRKLLKSLKMCESSCKLRVCFDLSLADLMSPAEFSKTFKQLHRCYSINRRAAAPLQLHIVGYSAETKSLMAQRSGCFNWDINFNPDTYLDVFERNDIVYLTSDSPNVIDTLDHSKVYIIGALVDHNRLKNTCYEKAVKEGVGHARLPLDTYFKFKTRKVLTIDQVYSIMLHLTEGMSWIDAVMETVPKRKGVEVKELDESLEKETSLLSEEDLKDCETSCSSFSESVSNANIVDSESSNSENVASIQNVS